MPEGLKASLRKPFRNDSKRPALRPLAARVRSIWPSLAWEWDREMKSWSLISHSEPQHRSYSPWVRGRFSLTLTPLLGEWIRTGFSPFLTARREPLSPSTSTGKMQAHTRNLELL